MNWLEKIKKVGLVLALVTAGGTTFYHFTGVSVYELTEKSYQVLEKQTKEKITQVVNSVRLEK